MRRTLALTVLFAVSAVLVTAAAALLAYRGVRGALEREFEQRVERIALRAASQISPSDVADPGARSSSRAAYTALQTLIGPLPAVADLDDASILDASRVTLVDALAREEQEGQPSPLDSLARLTLDQAYAGHAAVSPPYVREHDQRRAAVAPIRTSSGGVVGVVVIEAPATYVAALGDLSQRLILIALIALLAIAVLAVLFVRVASSTVQLERRLSRAENLAAMGQLTATLAHEIKNPLAIIRGSAERLGKLEPEARRMADFVIEETDRLANTVNRYLQFARSGGGSGGSGDALATLDQTLGLLEGEMNARRIALERGGASAGAAVELDNESLKQIYLNLMLNALEAMPEGGTLRVNAAEHGGWMEVTLADTGQGIAAADLARLGDPFFTTKARGSGLGLFLSRRLVQSAGGQLEIRSEPGSGTTCVIRWPRRKGTGEA
ncbi:MAG: two-component system sensor histidine kinase NtrB [Candidatus Eiseniibacteriota bacterium]